MPTPVGISYAHWNIPMGIPLAEGLSFCSGDSGLRRKCFAFDVVNDGSPVKGHPVAEKSCHRVAQATDRREAAAVAAAPLVGMLPTVRLNNKKKVLKVL